MKLTSVNYSAGSFNLGMLILRVGIGVLLVAHGYDKFTHYAQYSQQFINFMGIGQKASLALSIFAELFCAGLTILGLFTRIACAPIIINMLVAVFMAHKGKIFGEGEHAAMYAIVYTALLFVGPGRISIDGMMKQ